MDQNDFIKVTLPFENNLFNRLSNNIHFENIGKGRLGNQLVKVIDEVVPIVRTTSRYTIPTHKFSALHDEIIKSITNRTELLPEDSFNNALIEIYDIEYSKMKYHSDQCLDLADNSYIGLFSCYEKPDELEEHHNRVLKIKNKATNEEFDIPLTHNSFIFFSLEANTKFSHKIVLDQTLRHKTQESNNRWLGITFRKSKTFIQFKNNSPYFSNGELLEFANENQKKEFFILRGKENRSIDFSYPKINFTINKGDTLPPIE